MKTYIYKGEDRSAIGSIALVSGGIYKLSEDNEQVKSFEKRRLLVLVTDEKKSTSKKDKK